ncbi:hypothetical protein PGB90_005464 [Kerria lacca]
MHFERVMIEGGVKLKLGESSSLDSQPVSSCSSGNCMNVVKSSLFSSVHTLLSTANVSSHYHPLSYPMAIYSLSRQMNHPQLHCSYPHHWVL